MAGKPNPLVQKALALLKADPRMTTYEAIKITGANAQSVYSAARRLRGREGDDMPVCPTCGGLLKPGQVLKAMPAVEAAVPAQTAAGAGVLLRDRLKGADTAMREEAKRIVLDLTRYI